MDVSAFDWCPCMAINVLNSRLCELRIDYLIGMGEVRNGDRKVRKYLFSEIFYGRQAVSYKDFFSRII